MPEEVGSNFQIIGGWGGGGGNWRGGSPPPSVEFSAGNLRLPAFPPPRPLPLLRWPFPPSFLPPFPLLPSPSPLRAARGRVAGRAARLGFPAGGGRSRGAPWRAHLGLRTIWQSLCSKPTRACAPTLPSYPRKIIVSSFKINTRLAISTLFPNTSLRGARGRAGLGAGAGSREHSCRSRGGPGRRGHVRLPPPGPRAARRGELAGRPDRSGSAEGPPPEPGFELGARLGALLAESGECMGLRANDCPSPLALL